MDRPRRSTAQYFTSAKRRVIRKTEAQSSQGSHIKNAPHVGSEVEAFVPVPSAREVKAARKEEVGGSSLPLQIIHDPRQFEEPQPDPEEEIEGDDPILPKSLTYPDEVLSTIFEFMREAPMMMIRGL
ncbi:hypothetical protein FRC17_001705 [Serendipita sp. 399]|nr:hypothetical protein FRC17_001705 [Serendipita sp. 399]